MICARGKSKRRNLKLAARDAAGRFTLRRNSGRRSNAWAPLVLRWRQRRSARRTVRSDRVMSPVQQLLFPQTHFHFVTDAAGLDRRGPSFRVFPTTTVYRERVISEHSCTKTMTVHAPSQPHGGRRPSSFTALPAVSLYRERMVVNRNRTKAVTIDRVSHTWLSNRPSVFTFSVQQLQPQRLIEKTERLAASPPARSFTTPSRRQQRRLFIEQISSAARVKSQREEMTHIFRTHWRTYERQQRVLTLPSPATETFNVVSPRQRQSAMVQFDRPEELVWRRNQSPTSNYETDDGSHTGATPRREPVRSVVEETPAQSVSPAIARPTPQSITKLDPALLDRLTDDVIRRVEQRARIERQRRGL